MTRTTVRRRPLALATGALVSLAALVLAGCSKTASDAASSSASPSTSAAAPAASAPAAGSAASSAPAAGSASASASAAPVASGSAAAQQVLTTVAGSGSAGGGAAGGCTATTYGAPKLDLKTATVGFSQSEATSNPFRATETSSITAEAKKQGIKLIQRNANANVPQQNTDIENMIAQGATVLIVAPENSDGLAPALAQAKAKHIPVLTIDRTVTGKACSDFVGFIGSNFLGQAKIAADDLGTALGSAGGDVAVLEGTPGNNVAADRTNGFKAQIAAKYPNVKIVASQTANFDQATGQKVTEQLLQSNPNLKGIYAENDGMAFGAIQAIKAAGKVPGKDIKIVSIDGTEQAVQDVVAGTMVSDIETNPRFGPLAFQSLANFYAGTGVAPTVIIADHHFTAANAKAALANGDVY